MNIYSKLDSERFGIKVGKADEDFFQNNEANFFYENKFDLIISRIDNTNLYLINKLESLGFILCDIQAILYQKIVKQKVDKLKIKNKSYAFRTLRIEDIDKIMDLTKKSFRGYYGHYFNDKKLDNNKSLEAYIDWVNRSCTEKDLTDEIFVAEKNNEIAGYISVKSFLTKKGKYADGVLGAVSPKHQGIGLFRDLAKHILMWSEQNKCDWVQNNVIINNFPVFNTYISLGYAPKKVTVTLHGWVESLKLKKHN